MTTKTTAELLAELREKLETIRFRPTWSVTDDRRLASTFSGHIPGGCPLTKRMTMRNQGLLTALAAAGGVALLRHCKNMM
ncbi:hypothetical protein [Mycobacterium sp. TY813]|uniref:hypothetical protein n=1 Tax=Mycobacterium sp. TY813 TaxID=3050579 RepID=UPI0027413585|nr:hypothetical protein [Mycobacterium sp. TY813]MDP7732991.1 hypothetical protein [Mycobacterium sp. TY813]